MVGVERPLSAERVRQVIGEHYSARGLELPFVQLAPVESLLSVGISYEGQCFLVQSVDCEIIGECIINNRQIDGPRTERFFSWVSTAIDSEGVGVATYILAICDALDDGAIFRADPINGLTESSLGMWRRLVEMGVATTTGPVYSGYDENGRPAEHWDVSISPEVQS